MQQQTWGPMPAGSGPSQASSAGVGLSQAGRTCKAQRVASDGCVYACMTQDVMHDMTDVLLKDISKQNPPLP